MLAGVARERLRGMCSDVVWSREVRRTAAGARFRGQAYLTESVIPPSARPGWGAQMVASVARERLRGMCRVRRAAAGARFRGRVYLTESVMPPSARPGWLAQMVASVARERL